MLATSSACSDDPQRNVVAPVEPQSQAEVVVDRVLFGAGLRGLPGYRATMLPAPTAERLLSLAYPTQPIFVTDRDGDVYNARPLVAFGTGTRTILIVQNQNAFTCHACSGRTSIFYFDQAGSRLTASFPLALDGSDWGEPKAVQLVDLNGPSLLLRWNYQQAGYYGAGYVLYRLAEDGVRFLARFPALDSNEGMGEETPYYNVELAGAELTPDGRALTLRYSGYTEVGGEGSARREIERERSVTLDGVDEAWLAERDW